MLCHDKRGDNSQKLFRLHFQLLPRQSAGGYREGEGGQPRQLQLLLVPGNLTQLISLDLRMYYSTHTSARQRAAGAVHRGEDVPLPRLPDA